MNTILVFPGRQALLQYRRRLRQPVHWGALYTWAGRDSLLQALLRAIPAPFPLISDAAGQLAVRQALAKETMGPLQGIASSNKLPRKLWRLLLQIKAAGLHADQLRGSPVLHALGRLLAAYQQILHKAGLEDDADAMNRLLGYLAEHGLPSKFKQFTKLHVKDILWLRPLDMRLLLGMRGLVNIHLQFALPYIGSQNMLRLVNETANILERYEDLEITWPDSEEPDEASFSNLVFSQQHPGRVIVERPSGLYGEVEYLLKHARQQLAQGMAPEDILLVFPELNLYGQMAEDVARRLGVPLAFRRSQPLSHMPMCQALFNLLNLPDSGWEGKLLKKTIVNKYLFSFFDELLKKNNISTDISYSFILPKLLALLDKASYVDSVEQSLPAQLKSLPDDCRPLDDFLIIFFQELYNFVNSFNDNALLADYVNCILTDITPFLLPQISNYAVSRNALAIDPAQLLARDMQTWQQLRQSLQQLCEAGGQLGFANNNCQTVQEYVNSQASQQGHNQGIMVLRLEDAIGLQPKVLLAGGLTHSVLPSRPEAFVLGQADRLLLNQIAGMGVWRSQTEEYYGQLLRLNLLLANAGDMAVVTSPQADSAGQALRPSIWFTRLAQAFGVHDFVASAGVFGREPDLLQVYGLADLRLALVYNLYGNGRQRQLAHALLEEFPGIIADFTPHAWPPDNRFTDLSCLQSRLASIPHLSASSLNEYIICPQRWFFSYLCGLKEQSEATHDLNVMDEGSLAHALLAAYFAPDNFERLDSRPAIAGKLEDIWNQVVLRQKQHHFILQGRKPVILERLARVIESEYAHLNDMKPIATEKFFKFTAMPGLPPLLGVIDRIDANEREITITDYKYSTNIKEKDFLPDPAGSKNIQLLLYLAAVNREFPEKDMRARIVGCKDNRIFNVLNAPGQYWTDSDFFDQIRQIWQHIGQGVFTFSKDSDTCPRCAYNLICRFRDNHG